MMPVYNSLLESENWREENIVLLLNEQVTKENIYDNLKTLSKKIGLFSKFRLGNLPILLQIILTEDKSGEYPIIFNDLSMIIMIKSNKNFNEYPKRIISRIELLVKKIVS